MVGVRTNLENIRVINGRGVIYTVDEASAMVGIPRPTLYRYLREYSIPYTQRSGRISIPEESLGRIRAVRALHDEGLGTEAVRRRLREGSPDADWIAERLDRLSEALESSQANLKPTDGVSSSQALHIILARQSLLISAVFNLTEMMEELLTAAGRPRKPALDFIEEQSGRESDPATDRRAHPGTLAATEASAGDATPGAIEPVLPAARHDRFGTLARRRRRTALVLLLVVVLLAVLAWAALRTGLFGII